MTIQPPAPSLAQAVAYVQCLSPQDQLRLIAQIVTSLQPASATSASGWSAWDALRVDIAHAFPQAQLAARLDADRTERETTLQGHYPHDLHT